jgi:hypothetical protein
MASRERIVRILKREPVDRIGVYEHVWGDTLAVRQQEGRIEEGEDLATHFGLDAEHDRFFCASGINVFESMHPVGGHEHMRMGMALDPDWGRDMAMTCADLIIRAARRRLVL